MWQPDSETVFVLMPHVVHRLDIYDLNTRPVDIGTQNVVEVQRTPKTPVVVVPTTTVPSGEPSPVGPRVVLAEPIPITEQASQGSQPRNGAK